MKTLLSSRPVLWFLFLFNAAVAVAVIAAGHHLYLHGHTLHGSQQVMTAVGMGVVALGAGSALARRRPARSLAPARDREDIGRRGLPDTPGRPASIPPTSTRSSRARRS
jgi:hypothetical protein